MAHQQTKNWYAIYTNHNAEQTLNNCILAFSEQHELDYETYLPLLTDPANPKQAAKVKRQPMFRNYLFVRHDENAFFKVKNMKGFNRYIRFGPNPSVIPDEQMDIIKHAVKHKAEQTQQPKLLAQGNRVKISKGPFAGYQGIVLEKIKNHTVAIEIKSLKIYLSLRLPAEDVLIIS